MIRISQIKVRPGTEERVLYEKAARLLKIKVEDILQLRIVKQSIDARKKPDIWYSYVVEIEAAQEAKLVKRANHPQVTLAEAIEYVFRAEGKEPLQHRPVIVGTGPAGLFCGYFLAKHGYRPILLERGKDVDARQADVESFWQTGKMDPQSNVQFGEGGAGTFSDGKLNTLIKDKDGKGRKVLEIFHECGAPKQILYENKPHIGTDILRSVVKEMRRRIIDWGGEVRFSNELTDLIIEQGQLTHIQINHQEVIPCRQLVLAMGHSARDTFAMLDSRDIKMEAKSFAVGLRVEHPQSMIDKTQYGDMDKVDGGAKLPAASYKLTAQTSLGRGVYSFCMCPGGYVVNASSEPGRLAVNGMSYSGRDGKNANSAIIVSVTPEDFDSDHPLAGIAFQRRLEENAYQAGKGKVPVQTYGSFKAAVSGKNESTMDVQGGYGPCIKGEWTFTDITKILPQACNLAFVEGMEQFGSILPGFNAPETLLAGVESRTSSPVRIVRDQTGQSSLSGLYPCGEGAGYAGGITSAAMDGILIAEKIAGQYCAFRD